MFSVAALTAGLASTGIGNAAAAVGTVDGRAFGVSATGLVTIPETPLVELPATGGKETKTLLGFAEPGVVSASLLTVTTEGQTGPGGFARSSAAVANVNVGAGAVTADAVSSSCEATEAGLTGTTNLVNLVIAGNVIPIPVNPAPNTTITIPGVLTVILNEQTITNTPTGQQIVVNAVDVILLPGTAEQQQVILASSQCSVHTAVAPPPAQTGVLEICKAANNANGPVTGNFTFKVAGQTVTVPVGRCTGPLTVPAGRTTVTETANQFRISDCRTRPLDRLVKCDPANRQAIVRVVAGGVGNETVLTITNAVPQAIKTGAIKVCKIAGSGVMVGQNFNFTVGTKAITVPAGPASQGGTCKIVSGFERGKNVTVDEKVPSNNSVSKITVQPADRKVSTNNSTGTAVVTPRDGVTVVTFTNTSP